jgi:hypothetical protein
MWKTISKDMNFDNETDKADARAAWEWTEFDIPLQIKPKFTIETEGEESEADPATNPELQGELTKLLQSGHANIQKYFSDPKNTTDNGNGTYTVNIAGYKFTFTGGENAGATFEKEIGNALGIDTALSNTITNAISNSIPIMVESLGSLSGQAEPLSKVATALTEISSAITALSTATEVKLEINGDEIETTSNELKTLKEDIETVDNMHPIIDVDVDPDKEVVGS